MRDDLIVSALLDANAQSALDDLRAAHFPKDRNFLSAHLTLFHALPQSMERDVRNELSALRERESIAVEISKPLMLGRGVALRVVSAELLSLRKALASKWAEVLTPQDSAKSELHVTIQNKVAPGQAKALFADLNESWIALPAECTGLALWRYLDGPWEELDRYSFYRKYH